MLFILNHTHFDPYPYLLQATKHTDCVKCLTKRREINSKKKKKSWGGGRQGMANAYVKKDKS